VTVDVQEIVILAAFAIMIAGVVVGFLIHQSLLVRRVKEVQAAALQRWQEGEP